MTEEKLAREDEIDNVKETVKEVYAEKFAGHEDEGQLLKEVKQIAEDLEKDVVRELITIDKIRPDGRKLDEIRPLASEVGLLPRVHGSGLFTRGQTQALSACTLAPLGEHQIIDGLGVKNQNGSSTTIISRSFQLVQQDVPVLQAVVRSDMAL